MKAAIYARYSSENQSEKSIDDQIRVCKNYIEEHGMSVGELKSGWQNEIASLRSQ